MATFDRRIHPAFVQRYMAARERMPNIGVEPATLPRSRPQCTHTTVMRLYGKHHCDSCGRRPSMGWLYLCVQDVAAYNSPQYDNYASLDSISDLTDDAHELASLGISPSIVAQLQAGLYDSAQVQVIKAQKRHVQHIIAEDTVTSSRRWSSIAQDTDTTPRRNLKKSPPPDSPNRKTPFSSAVTCRFKCCHRCRPFLLDRLYTSFEAIWCDQEPPITDKEMKNLRVLDSTILSNLGRATAVLDVNERNTECHDFAMENASNLRTALDTTVLDDTLSFASASASPPLSSSPMTSYPNSPKTSVSSISLPTPPSSRFDKDEFDFDGLEIRKADTWHHLSHNRLASLDTSVKSSRASSLRGDAHAGASRHSSVSSYQSTYSGSSHGNEIEVEGGVALTEEAVGLGLPDVATTTATTTSTSSIITQS